MAGGKTSTTTSQTAIPQEVLNEYTSVNQQAQTAAAAPFQPYSSDPNAFVAPLNVTQQAGILGTDAASGQAQPYFSSADDLLQAGYGAATGVNLGAASQYRGAYNSAQPYNASAGTDYLSAQSSAQPYNAAAGTDYLSAQNSAQPYNAAAGSGFANTLANVQPVNQQAQNYYTSGLGSALDLNAQGAGPANPTALTGAAVNQYLSPYLADVLGSTEALTNQTNQQAMAGQLGNAVTSGAFGGDRAGIAAANLAQQQTLAEANAYSNIANQGYNTALGTAQQQQGVGLSAQQANLARLSQAGQNAFGYTSQAGQNEAGLAAQDYGQGNTTAQNLANLGQTVYGQQSTTGQNLAGLGQNVFGQQSTTGQNLAGLGQNVFGQGSQYGAALASLGNQQFNQAATTSQNTAGLGTGAQAANIAGAQAQLAAGQTQQQTQQAGQTALYNQFLQQQGYPFQTAQFLANIAEGTGSLSGSTTTTTQPAPFFSDERLKEDIEPIGKTFDGENIVKFRYKGSPQKQIGLIAQDVEKHHPEAVGSSLGYKTVDYDEATKEAASLGDRPHLAYGGVGGGPGSPYDVSAILAAQQAGYANAPWAKAGLYGEGVSGSPGLSGYVPKATLATPHLVTSAGHAPPPPQSDLAQLAQVAQQGSQLATAGQNLGSLGSKLWNNTIGAPAPVQSKRGGAIRSRYDIGGSAGGDSSIDPYGDPVSYIPNDQPQHTQLLSGRGSVAAPVSPFAQLTQVGSAISTLGNAAEGLSGILFSRGGFADGGDPTLDAIGETEDDVRRAFPKPNSLADVGNTIAGGASDVGNAVGDALGLSRGDGTPAPPLSQRPSSRDYASVPGYSAQSAALDPANSNLATPPVTAPVSPAGLGDVPLPPRRPAGLGDAAPADGDTATVPVGSYRPHGRQQVWMPDQASVPPSAYSANAADGSLPRNERNNNPGNIIDGGFAKKMPGYSGSDGTFAVFDSPQAGAHAADVNLQSYGHKGLNTPSSIVNTWSPPNAPGNSPNATRNYATYVAGKLGIGPNDQIDMSDPGQRSKLLTAMSEFEGGQTGGGSRGGDRPASLASPPQQAPQSGGLAGVPAAAGNWVNQNQNWLLPVLSGLGGMASSNSRYLGSAILQGLGTGANTYATMENQAAQRGLTGAETGRTEAETQAKQAETARGAFNPSMGGMMWVKDPTTGQPRLMMLGEYQSEVAAGRTPQPWTGTSSSTPAGPQAGGVPTPAPPPAPVAPSVGDKTAVAPTGVYDDKSRVSAKDDMRHFGGQSYDMQKGMSEAYNANAAKGLTEAQAISPYTQELARTLVSSYGGRGLNVTGPAAPERAEIVNMLNALSHSVGMNENFDDYGDLAKNEAIVSKVNALQGQLRAQSGDESSWAALRMLTHANPNLSQDPRASSQLVAQLMADQAKATDRAQHTNQYARDSGGNLQNASLDFQRANPTSKYNVERDQLADLMLKQGPYFNGLMSQNLSQQDIAADLQKRGLNPSLARYFSTGG